MAKKNMFTNVEDAGILDVKYHVSGSRWSYGYSVFKNNFPSIMLLNLIMLVSAAPILYLLYLRLAQVSVLVASSPFSANIGIGYFPQSSLLGLEQEITLSANQNCFIYMPIAALLFGVGLSGGLYTIRNMFWGQKVKLLHDFGQGIKRNVLNVVILTLIYTVILGLSIFAISFAEYFMAVESHNWMLVVSEVLLYILIAMSSLMYLSSIVMTVTYKVKFFSLIKNSFVMSIILLPLNLFFAAFSLLPFILFIFGGILRTLSMATCLFFGFSFFMVVWTDYCHWIYDRFINPSLVKKAEETPQKPSVGDKKVVTIATLGTNDVSSSLSHVSLRAIKPITDQDVAVEGVPMYFSLSDIEKLNDSKKQIVLDGEEYEKSNEIELSASSGSTSTTATAAETKKKAKKKK